MKQLADILSPLSVSSFISDVYEKRHIVIKRNNSDYFAKLFQASQLYELLLSNPDLKSNIRLSRYGLTSSPFLDTHGRPLRQLVEDVLHEYGNGASVIVDSVQNGWPPLNALCQRLVRETTHGWQANMYCTPSGGVALDEHYDTHDVFVLQLEGSKRWEISEPPLELPSASLPSEELSYSPTKLLEIVDLHAGDTLYLPRGFVHRAIAMGSGSIHIALGLIGRTWEELLVEMVRGLAIKSTELRRTLPLGYGEIGSVGDTFEVFRQRLKSALGLDAELDTAVERITTQVYASPLFRGHFSVEEINKFKRLKSRSIITLREDTNYKVFDSASYMAIYTNGREIRIGNKLAEGLRDLFSAGTYVVNADDLNDKQLIDLLALLYSNGLLSIIEE